MENTIAESYHSIKYSVDVKVFVSSQMNVNLHDVIL
jgi:hypothetical protein